MLPFLHQTVLSHTEVLTCITALCHALLWRSETPVWVHPALTAPSPQHLCTLVIPLRCFCLFLSHTHRDIYTHILVFSFRSTVAHLPRSLYNLVGLATTKVFLSLGIAVATKGAGTFLTVSWHLAFPWPSGYNIKVAMKAIDSMLYPLPLVQLKAKCTGLQLGEKRITGCSDGLVRKG